MLKFNIKLSAEQPLLIKDNRGTSNLMRTLDYIPGSQVRGKIASWLNDQEDVFQDIIFSDKVRFNNFYINGAQIIPLSAWSCKYYPGFFENEGQNHGVFDILLNKIRNSEKNIIANCKKNIKNSQDLLIDDEKDISCGAVLKQFDGYYLKENDKYKKVSVEKDIIEKTAINNKSNNAEIGSLYLHEIIEPNQVFVGTITVMDDNTNIKEKIKNVLENKSYAYFGSANSRGNGKMKIEITEINDYSFDKCKQEIEQKHKKLNKQIMKKDETEYFIITLNSDAIIHDELLNYKKQIDITDLIYYTPYLTDKEISELNKFKLSEKDNEQIFFAETTSVFGWNGLNNLPKPVQKGIKKGSTFVYSSQNKINRKILLKGLTRISQFGVGVRKNEGYGSVRINDDFHIENIKEGK